MNVSSRGPGWREAFLACLEELAVEANVEKGVGALQAALVALSEQPFIAEQLDAVARSGDPSGVESLLQGRVRVERGQIESIGAEWSVTHIEDNINRWRVQLWIFVRDAVHEWRSVNRFTSHAKLLEIVQAWSTAYLAPSALERREELAWHDHAAALRSENLLWFASLLHASPLDPREYLDVLYKLIEVHCAVLAAEDFYSVGTNHGFDQAYALYLLCAVFPFGPRQAQFKELGLRRLMYELGLAFADDGAHIENSPSYHVWMSGRLSKVEGLLAAFDPDRTLPISGIMDRAVRFLTHALKPDCTLPLLGDTELQRLHLSSDYRSAPNYASLQFVCTGGERGAQPNELVAVFSRSGYAFLRDRWPSSTTPSNFYLALKCGFLSEYHRHDDDNTLLLFAFGEDWLVGSGIYKYEERHPIRRYLRSAAAHNLLAVDGVEADRTQTGRAGVSLLRDDAEATVLEGRSRMFPGFCYTRRVAFDRREGVINLVDRLDPDTPRPYECTLRFHVPGDRRIEVLPNGSVKVTSFKTRRSLVIQVNSVVESVEVAAGRHDPPLGWTSPRRNVLEAAYTLAFRVRCDGSHEIQSRLAFLSGDQPGAGSSSEGSA